MKIEFIATPESIEDYLITNFPDIIVADSYGERAFFYNPDNVLKRGIYFCTIKSKNGPNDKASALDRENVFRLNFGISKNSFLALFSVVPSRAAKGEIIAGDYNFQITNHLTPHPVYGWMTWVSILNPLADSWGMIEKLLLESYDLCKQKFDKKWLVLKNEENIND